ncbi:MAG: hypothetical protein JWL81_2308 [Verrucomicrobiales bacterium]|nr:hypothetical protein [Verrucomicrobiales bacterium]
MTPRLTLLLLLAAGALAVVLHREQQRGTFEAFDRGHREFLRANPGSSEWTTLSDEPQVILARLDDPDVPPAQRAFEAWPPRPDEWQVVLQNLAEWQPRAVTLGFPIVVESPSAGFLKTLAAVPGFTMGADAGAAFRTGFMPPELPGGLPILRVQGELAGIPEFETLRPVTLPVRVGIAQVDLGQKIAVEGEWCRVPLLARTGTQVVPTLALQSLLTWSTIPPDKLLVQPGTAITGPRGMAIPIDETGCFRFYIPLSARAGSVQADEFLFPKTQAESTYAKGTPERAALEATNGSLIWIGADDQSSRYLKLADGNTASVADLTTRALAAMQTGRFIRPLAAGWQIVPQVVAILFGLWLLRWKRRNLWKGLAISTLLFLTASLLAFQTNHTWIPLAPALIQVAAAFVIGVLMPRPTTHQPPPPPCPSTPISPTN